MLNKSRLISIKHQEKGSYILNFSHQVGYLHLINWYFFIGNEKFKWLQYFLIFISKLDIIFYEVKFILLLQYFFMFVPEL